MNNESKSVGWSELAAGWPIIVGSFIGLFFSVGTLVVYTFGLFAPQFALEFGWGRGEIAFALTVFSYTIVVAAPLYGYLIDRFGARPIIIISTLLYAPTFALLYFQGAGKTQFYMIFMFVALLGGGTLPISYSRIIVGWFHHRRGLALGLSLIGVGMGAAILPPLIQIIIDSGGWRNAVLILSIGILVISLPGAVLLLRSPPEPVIEHKSSIVIGNKSFLGRKFWVLAVFSMLSGIFLVGAVVHFVPILLDRGIEPATAAKYASLLGVSVIVGRITIGYLVDYIFAPRVIFAFYLAPIMAFLVLCYSSGDGVYVVAAIAFGLSLGAEIDVIAYMVSRYFLPAQFGKVYGLMFAAFTIGTANGPLLMGVLYDRDGNYINALLVSAIIATLAAISTFFLPRFKSEI